MCDSVSLQVNIDRDEVLRYLGYKGQSVTEEMSALIDRQMSSCKKLAKPGYLYGRYDVCDNEGGVYLQDTGIVLVGKDISAHLNGCCYCVLMAVTCGMGVERELLRLQRMSMTEAVVFDACANAYVECLADCVQRIIEQEAAEDGKYINYRYSPGYGDFPLDMQRVIVPAMQCEKRIGLTVTDNALLVPHKSVTAVVGVFDNKKDTSCGGCEKCNMYDRCNIRKAGNRCDR